MNLTRRQWIEAAFQSILLACLVFLNSCSSGKPVSVRYKFSSPSFSSEELKKIQSTVQSRIKTHYDKRDGKSAGCDWVLLKKGDPDEAKNRIYFSDTKKTDTYVLGISGKQAFLDFVSAIETEMKKQFPDKEYEVSKTSKMEKSIQFLKSEL